MVQRGVPYHDAQLIGIGPTVLVNVPTTIRATLDHSHSSVAPLSEVHFGRAALMDYAAIVTPHWAVLAYRSQGKR